VIIGAMPLRILHVRTSKTASTALQTWVGINQEFIKSTDNTKWLNQPNNQNKLQDKQFNIYITSVRNPYRRAYSQYKYLIRDNNWKKYCTPQSFKEFLEIDFTKINHQHLSTHMTPISYYLGKSLNGKTVHYLKAERLYEDIGILCKTYDLKPPKEKKIIYETHYYKPEMNEQFKNKEIRELCYNKYKDDFINFNYNKEDYKDLYPEQAHLKSIYCDR
jgi:hypothetical protein